jgi:hypothetical protein
MVLIALPYLTDGEISILRSIVVPVVNTVVGVLSGQGDAVG